MLFCSKLLDPCERELCLGRRMLEKNLIVHLLHYPHKAIFLTNFFRASFNESNIYLPGSLIVDPELLKMWCFSDNFGQAFIRGCCFEVPAVQLENLDCLESWTVLKSLENLMLLVICQLEVLESERRQAGTFAQQLD